MAYVYGTASSDILNADDGITAGDDTVYAGDGHDTIRGLGGNDILYGEDGRDTIYGGDGVDWLDGGKNDDTDAISVAVAALTAAGLRNVAVVPDATWRSRCKSTPCP